MTASFSRFKADHPRAARRVNTGSPSRPVAPPGSAQSSRVMADSVELQFAQALWFRGFRVAARLRS
jgi:hypothetical protein